MPAVMVQGCTSGAGKSLLSTALCRWYADRGLRVAPFKGQNMSNNARVVAGGELGVAQWLQALAARAEPDVRMGPVLVKPERDGSQVVVLGRVDSGLSRRGWTERRRDLWPTIAGSLDELINGYDLVICEGAGSPAEINLRDTDLANMRVAAHAGAPVLLVADIDRGGAFAHLYGTWALLAAADRSRLDRFVLNRFRGDQALLRDGPGELAACTGMPYAGLLPMLAHRLPDERGLDVAVARAAAAGIRIWGICGGLDLLGEHRVGGPDGLEDSGPGLGLLPVVTDYAGDKLVGRVRIRFADDLPAPWRTLAGIPADAYDIRHGRSRATGSVAPALPEDRGLVQGNVLGVACHGLLENPAVVAALIGPTPDGAPSQHLDAVFDELAAAVSEHLDVHLLERLTGGLL